jgi:NAD(P)-dependent dehydrogenase (short-subunit alcohol dehydrogenase family)
LDKQKIAVVTGSSSGIGFATSLLLARNGFHTFATMRNTQKSETIKEIANNERLPLHVVQLDVNSDSSVKDAIENILVVGETSENKNKNKNENNGIDVLVNNAGYALIGCVEDLSIEEIKAQFESNLFGMIRVSQAALPYMKNQMNGGSNNNNSSGGSSVIVNISAITGRISFPGISAYSSTKFAIEAFSESMAYELKPFGMNVVLIEPGTIKTNIINSSITAKNALDSKNSHYRELTHKVYTVFKSMQEHAAPPEEVARTILHAVSTKNPKRRYLVGSAKEKMAIRLRPYISDKIFSSRVVKRMFG